MNLRTRSSSTHLQYSKSTSDLVAHVHIFFFLLLLTGLDMAKENITTSYRSESRFNKHIRYRNLGNASSARYDRVIHDPPSS